MIRKIRIGQRVVEYTLICTKNRKTDLLQALPEGKIRVYAPAGESLRRLDNLVRDNIGKIDEAHRKLRAVAERTHTDGLPKSVPVEGTMLPLEVRSANVNRVYFNVNSVLIETAYKTDAEILGLLKRAYAETALNRFRMNLDKWSPTIGKAYGRVTVREQKTRWGSCSSKSNLNFNWKLIMAPPRALEYVVIHELCHLLYFNHSAQFWNEVAKRMPDYEIWKKWLKQHGNELYIG